MKTFYKIVLCTLSLFTLLVSCQKQDNPFNVDGDCRIDSLVLDEIYPGVVDHASATVTVAVPEVHDDHLMTLTTLRLSAGAKATPALHAQRALRGYHRPGGSYHHRLCTYWNGYQDPDSEYQDHRRRYRIATIRSAM